MEEKPIYEKLKKILLSKQHLINARLFVTREDGISVYDSVQNATTASVSALVSGVWQASDALIALVAPFKEEMSFRLAFDTSSQGVYLLPLSFHGKKYFLGAVYDDCLNPGLLKRQIGMIKHEIETEFVGLKPSSESNEVLRQGYLFQDISDKEMDNLFSLGGI
jgi:hypothetical protein